MPSFLGSSFNQSQQASSDSKPSLQTSRLSPSATPPAFQEPEPFVPPEALEIPHGMEIVSIEGWKSSISPPFVALNYVVIGFCFLMFC